MSKTLVFDGDCPLCCWVSAWVGRLGIVGAKRRRAFQSFDGDLALRLEEAGIRNEMLVLDEESGELRAGVEGFLWLARDGRFRTAAALIDIAPLRALARLAYRTVAYNRRTLAPPPVGVVCACDPDPHDGFRALFWSLVVLVNLGVAWLFGVSAGRAFEPLQVGGALTLWVLAWPAAALLGRVISPRPTRATLAQVVMAMTAAALSAAPVLALALLASGLIARLLVGFALGLAAWRLAAALRSRLWPGVSDRSEKRGAGRGEGRPL